MDITIHPCSLSGVLKAIPSKSQAHRLLICAAFSDGPTDLICPETNQDIEATVSCLMALGASITRTPSGYQVQPIDQIPQRAELHCRESGSTLRFMLPIVGALGVDTVLHMEGRLPKRPLSPMWEEMVRMGCSLSRPTEATIRCSGKLRPGAYSIDGSVSSQYITGLLFAASLIHGKSSLKITGRVESKPYIDLTRKALQKFGVDTEQETVGAQFPFHTPGTVAVEGDWSNGAFFLAAKALGNDLEISGLEPDSPQGDRAVARILPELKEGFIEVDASDIPDLVPILAVTAGALHGARFTNISRLRLKESDRVASVENMLRNLGAETSSDAQTLTVAPAKYHGCTIDAVGDHRIAMSAAIAATASSGPVTILGAQCVAKSYPSFWEEYSRLGGKI